MLYVVDDLDRCSHAGVVKTLEAVRLVMGIPQVIVIIAIDQRIALASLALHYKDLAGYHEQGNPGMIARDYLGKVIQLPIYLHAADNDTITAFVDRVLLDESAITAGTHKDEVSSSGVAANQNFHQISGESTHSSPSQPYIRNVSVESIKNDAAIEKIEYQFSPLEKKLSKNE